MCSEQYPLDKECNYMDYYSMYPYNLHNFQKWSIEAIVTGNDLLVCCPTGSGKTFSGEFALNYFYKNGKKTIYTTPIKALSNEKYYNFTQKYPNISVGLITGDIKTNPDADVLIMTTEILLNKLYQLKSSVELPKSSISFDMDIENELGCVVFDEIHMINDENRGTVWEQCIMMLPEYVQLVGLSATLDKPEEFAQWLETKGDVENTPTKEVYLTRKTKRAVPLIHYSYITVNTSIFKKVKDKVVQEQIKSLTNKPFILQNSNGILNETNYLNMTKMLSLFNKNDVYVKRQQVLNNVCKYLVENDMLPALCYVFSRKQLEKCANELTTNLLEFDSKVPYTIDKECENIIRKLPNYEEYLFLPEYVNTVKLLRKGIGIHHAGLMPILREMTEILFSKGFIKILFCTETMSVGINLPVKTTIFTEVNKYDGNHLRLLHGHEYTQAAGRAGRLGLDSIGHVIHLNNLFRNIESISYKKMLKGQSQKLQSKFKISYNLLLNLIDINDSNFIKFVNKSMINNDIQKKICAVENEKNIIIDTIKNVDEHIIKTLKTPIDVIKNYVDLCNKIKTAINKKKKQMSRDIQNIEDNYKNIQNDVNNYNSYSNKLNKIECLNKEYINISSYIKEGIIDVFNVLKHNEYVCSNESKLTDKGNIACQLKEVHCLVFSDLIISKRINKLSAIELIMFFSCFTNVTINDDNKDISPNVNNNNLIEIITYVNTSFDYYRKEELKYNFKTGIDYSIQYDLLNYLDEWCTSSNVNECKLLLERMEREKNIFLGEFVKALLKINNISNELEKIAEMINDIEFLSNLKNIPVLTLKYVATNQSLYV